MDANLQQWTRLPTDALIEAYGQVQDGLYHAMCEESSARALHDRQYTNHYAHSLATSHAAKEREAEFHTLDDKLELDQWVHQVAIHRLMADYIARLIDWRMSGEAPRIQRGISADSEA